MREIKFRFFNKKENRMEMSMHCDPKLLPIAEDDVYAFKLFADFYELMQYTGLKDKNGKEIYEGDIVEFPTGVKATVVFQLGCFNCLFSDGVGSMLALHNKIVTILGTIYEKPDLLKGDKP